MAVLDKVPRGEGITAGVTASKALVGHVEEGKVALLLHHTADLAPLVLGGINAGRVVGAGVKQDNAVAGGRLDIRQKAFEVKADCVLVVVAVLLNLQAAVLEDSIVVGPAGGREVDLLRVRVEALEESTTNAQGTGTRDGLGDAETVLLDHGRVGAIGELGRGRGEGRETGDAGVFFVEFGRDNFLLGGANGRQDIWFALVVT